MNCQKKSMKLKKRRTLSHLALEANLRLLCMLKSETGNCLWYCLQSRYLYLVCIYPKLDFLMRAVFLVYYEKIALRLWYRISQGSEGGPRFPYFFPREPTVQLNIQHCQVFQRPIRRNVKHIVCFCTSTPATVKP